MKLVGRLTIVGAILLATGVLLGGTGSVARVFMEIGLAHLAAKVSPAPGLRGAALFRSGSFEDAAIAFEEAGDDYNQGLAAAWAGDYATALVAWERALAADPADREALANHTLVTALLAGIEFEPVAPPDDRDQFDPEILANPGQGKARATAQGDDATNRAAGFWMPELSGQGLRTVRHQFDSQYMAANDRWLATLEDQPGIYLRSRLAFEQKARIHAGTALPETEDPR